MNERARLCPCCGGYRDQYDACHFHGTRDEAQGARAEADELRAAIIEHRKHHPKLTSNADTQLWWKAGLEAAA